MNAIKALPNSTSSAVKTRVGLFMINTVFGFTTPWRSHFESVFAWIPTSLQNRRRVSAASNAFSTDADPFKDPASCRCLPKVEIGRFKDDIVAPQGPLPLPGSVCDRSSSARGYTV